jgi:glycine betaine/choline ABC-type transport system substrate-binding protein
MKNVRRRPTGHVVGLLMLALVLIAAGCGSSSKSSSSSSNTTPGSGPRIDSLFVFGGPPECPERDLCLGPKSQQVYGFKFKEIKKLDAGGPITSKALKDNTIQVGELFTGSSVIDPDFVLLKDDKGLQPADNPTALIKEAKATDDVKRIIDDVNSKMTLEAYNKMATSIDIDKIDPSDAAAAFLQDAGLDTKGTTGNGQKLTVGAMNFTGARAISEAYSQALKNNGYDVTFKDNIGTREQLYPLLKNGTVDLYGEFTGSLLTYLKGTPSGDSAATYSALQQALQGTGLVATTPSAAQDVNGFYVTKETADKYKLVTMSDLTKNS